MKHLNIRIYGQVQGVVFRASAKKVADSLSLMGFAQNTPDGSVYIEVEGEEENLQKFIKWCRKGPDLAKIERVQVTNGPVSNFTDFSIR